MYTIFLADLLTQLKHKFPNLTCRGENGDQWIRETAYADDLTLCDSSPSNTTKDNANGSPTMGRGPQCKNKPRQEFCNNVQRNNSGENLLHHRRGHQLGSTSSFPIPARKKHTRSPRSQVPRDHHRRQPRHGPPLSDTVKKTKMGTAKVIGYQKTFRRSGDFGYQQHIMLVIWKALVLSHSTRTSSKHNRRSPASKQL